jgi:2-oxo-4-hydroxy-4-carboxy-5-ureidoimidazoline decarboxylase
VTLAELNRLDERAFIATLGGIYEHSPWVANGAARARPFGSIDQLAEKMAEVVASAGEERQLALLRAHPELAGKAMVRNELTADSTGEQAGAGLNACSAAEFARLTELNARYIEKFGFPFILAVKGYDRAGVIAEFARRVERDRAKEFRECLRQVDRIARLRLDALLG